MNCELFELRRSRQISHERAAAALMKQLTRVVERNHNLGGGVGAGGQQHLGQHSGADPPQMSHSQLADITEPEVGQDLLC